MSHPTSATTYRYEYVFGFGSLLNTSTHAAWMEQQQQQHAQKQLKGQVVSLKASFGYERAWNFRSPTGFTALGIQQCTNISENKDMNGVLFQVPMDIMPVFDKREAGYDKVRIPLNELVFEQDESGVSKSQPLSDHLTDDDRIWVYVPQKEQCQFADESHPLLQSYVDTVLQGCLEWGGISFCETFVLTTSGWSTFFLNDTPNSRRPWLFRQDYDSIDTILKKHATLTHYEDRKHPEEFASAVVSMRKMRGLWSVPRRNPNFTGRETELQEISQRFDQQGGHHSVYVQVVGMGGVGKTQLCVEYCYRSFPGKYGLILWCHAESSEALIDSYRQLWADVGEGGKMGLVSPSSSTTKDSSEGNGVSSEELIQNVKSRLFRSVVPWLLVLDNLESPLLLEKFVPQGQGHVLVTTRRRDWSDLPTSVLFGVPLVLNCFQPNESIDLLKRASGSKNMDGVDNENAAKGLADTLGHLPLALGMAAAYMQRCDVSCREYLDRFLAAEDNKTHNSLLSSNVGDHMYSHTVAASISMSLTAIVSESVIAEQSLKLLAFLGPDQITKQLLRSLLRAKAVQDEADDEMDRLARQHAGRMQVLSGVALASGAFLGFAATRRTSSRLARSSLVTASLSSLFLSGMIHLNKDNCRSRGSGTPTSCCTVCTTGDGSDRPSISAIQYEQADNVWNILKSYSLLLVREGKGSIHRLLSQSLRSRQAEEEKSRNICICVAALASLWSFHPDRTESWQDSLPLLEHVKTLVSHSLKIEKGPQLTLVFGRLSREIGVFSGMALNQFLEAQKALEMSLAILREGAKSGNRTGQKESILSQASSLHELGKVFRYQGNYDKAESVLQEALDIRQTGTTKDDAQKADLADTLHELGVLEAKKHKLDKATDFLQQALEVRQHLGIFGKAGDSSDYAATLHQLAAVYVARKPPMLDQGLALLQEALKLSNLPGQRAASLKQIARVTIRQGRLDEADRYLEQALELYVELYGENKMHMNIAAVKFQQGALSLQQRNLDKAWMHFTECLNIRRHIYSYAIDESDNKQTTTTYPMHLEVSCVLNELARVAYSQRRYQVSNEYFEAERNILEHLDAVDRSQKERLHQARLTNLTWLQKVAKGLGNDEMSSQLASERLALKHQWKQPDRKPTMVGHVATISPLQSKAIECRLLARSMALKKGASQATPAVVERKLQELSKLNSTFPYDEKLQAGIDRFCTVVSEAIPHSSAVRRREILTACDDLRELLRAAGVSVVDPPT